MKKRPVKARPLRNIDTHATVHVAQIKTVYSLSLSLSLSDYLGLSSCHKKEANFCFWLNENTSNGLHVCISLSV